MCIRDRANIAQMVNVLQSLFLTKGPQAVLTPTYHVFDMYKDHMGNKALKVDVESPVLFEPPPPKDTHPWMPLRKPKPLYSLNASASLKEGVEMVLTLVNSRVDEEMETEIAILGNRTIREGYATVLTSDKTGDYNDFDTPNLVKPVQEALEIRGKSARFTYIAPVHSVNSLLLKLV